MRVSYLFFFIIILPYLGSSQIKNVSVKYVKAYKNHSDSSENPPKIFDNLSYILLADNKSSFFKKTEAMQKDNDKDNRLKNKGNDKGSYYNDLHKNITLHNLEFNGTTFIIEYPFNKYDWEIKNEFKTIGGYKCFKATSKYIFFSELRQKNIEINLTAWFTKEIPIPFGPTEFRGLPGLVLEARKGSFYYIANFIKFNLDNNKIPFPKEGEKITSEEFDNLIVKIYSQRRND